MAIQSASTSLTRFRVVEQVPKELWPDIPDLLKKYAFRDIDDTTDERSFGWVAFEDMLDTRWTQAPPEKGEFLAFSLRLDTRRVPPAIFKKYFIMAQREEEQKLKEEGRKYLSRDRKKELKEQVMIRLMARTLPIPAVFNVAWNISTGIVYFDSIRAKVLELFANHFTETFDLHLEPLTPFNLAIRLLDEKTGALLEELEPTAFA